MLSVVPKPTSQSINKSIKLRKLKIKLRLPNSGRGQKSRQGWGQWMKKWTMIYKKSSLGYLDADLSEEYCILKQNMKVSTSEIIVPNCEFKKNR